MLEANEKQVPPKSYSLKIIDSVNQILKNKENIRKPVTLIYWPELQTGKFHVYILMSII